VTPLVLNGREFKALLSSLRVLGAAILTRSMILSFHWDPPEYSLSVAPSSDIITTRVSSYN